MGAAQGNLVPAALVGNAACFMGHRCLPDTRAWLEVALLFRPRPHTGHPPPTPPPEQWFALAILAHALPGGHTILPDPGAVLATRGRRADTHQLHADDKGWPCSSEVQDWDPGLGPFLRGGSWAAYVAPCSPRLPCSQFDTPQMGTRAMADPGLDLLPNTLAQPSTAGPGLPRQAKDRPRPGIASSRKWGWGQQRPRHGALWGS